MELGALVCTPTAPRCDECPLARNCVARRQNRQESIPPRKVSAAPTTVREAAIVIRRRGRVLLVQRPDVGRWPGMWEFPHAELRDGESVEAGARTAWRPNRQDCT